jgi:hypothetical protein
VAPLQTEDAWTHLDSLDPRAATRRADLVTVEFNNALTAVAMRHHELLASLRSINARLRENASASAVIPPDHRSRPGESQSVASPRPLATDGRSDAHPRTADSASNRLHINRETASFSSKRDYNYFDKLDKLLAALGQGLLGPRPEATQPSQVSNVSTSDQR